FTREEASTGDLLTNQNIPFDYRPVPFAANCLTPAQPRTIPPHATLPKFIKKHPHLQARSRSALARP
ncbi:hypothetical protein, partial [Pseudomonas putida]